MALTEKLEMLLSANADGAVSEFQRLGKEADRNLTATETKFKSFASNVTKLGVGGLGIGGLLTSMASKDEEAANQLKAAVGQVGQSYSDFSSKVDDAAAAQVRFGHTDEEVKGALTTLTLAYGDTNKALDEMQLVADLAARKHISLEEAASAVAKAHGGAARLFKEFGIQVDSNTANTGRYDDALTQLADKLKGQAAASADSFGGKLRALGAWFENTASDIGQKFGPAILGVSALMTAFGPVVSAVSTKLLAMRTAHLADAEAAEADGAANLGMAGTLGLVAAAVGIAILGYEGYKNSVQESIDVSNISQASTKELVQVWDASTGSLGGVNRQLDWFTKVTETSRGTAKRLRDELAGQGQDVSRLDQILAEYDAGQKQANADMSDGTDIVKQYDTALKNLHDTLHGELDPLFAAYKALRGNTDAQADAAKATAAVWQATKDAADAHRQYGDASDEARTADEKLWAARVALNDANVKTAESALSVHDATTQLAGAMQDGTLSVTDAKDKLNEWVAQGLLTKGQADEVSTAFDGLGVKAGQLDGKNVFMAVHADTEQASKDLQHLIDQATWLIVGHLGGITGTVGNPDSGFQTPVDIPIDMTGRTRAMGGSGLPGQAYFIEPGTHGEWFTPSGLGWFTPSSQMNTSNEAPVVQHIYAPTDPWAQQQAARLERQKERYLSRSGR